MARYILLATLAMLFNSFAYAEIYSWVDNTGQRHFGDEKPKKQTSEEVEVQPNITGYQMVNKDLILKHKDAAIRNELLVMYSTAWCSYCKKARAFLKQNKIKYREYDIEKNRKAKAKYKKLGGTNVPFFSYRGQTYRGFNEYGFMSFYQPLKQNLQP